MLGWLLDTATTTGVDVTLTSRTSPTALLPTVSSEVWLSATKDSACEGGGGGATVREAERLRPLQVAVRVIAIGLATAAVVTAKVALVPPAATATLAGTDATPPFVLARVTATPPAGAAAVSVTVPVAETPPVTLAGETAKDDRVGASGAAWAVKRRVLENEPATPAELRARTRHHNRCPGRPPMIVCDPVSVRLATKGAASVAELSTWIS